MALVGFRAFVAIALIILAPTETRSDIGGGHGKLSAQMDHMAGSSDSFAFFQADSAPTLKIPAVDLSAVSLRDSLASLSRFSIAEEVAGGGNLRNPAKQTNVRDAFVLSPSLDQEEPRPLLRAVRVDYPVANVLRSLESGKTSRDRIGGAGVSNSVVPEPAVLILMLIGLPLVMRRRLSASTK